MLLLPKIGDQPFSQPR